MKLSVKSILFLSLLFLSAPASAYVSDYVSSFKPAQKKKNIRELTSHIKKDIVKLRSLLKTKNKKITGLMEIKGKIETTSRTTEI